MMVSDKLGPEKLSTLTWSRFFQFALRFPCPAAEQKRIEHPVFNPFLAMMLCMKSIEALVSLRSGSNTVWVLLQQLSLLAAAFNMQAAELTNQDIIF